MSIMLLRVDSQERDPINLPQQLQLSSGLTLGRTNAAPTNTVSRKELAIEHVSDDEVLARIVGASPLYIARQGQPREASSLRELRPGAAFSLRPGDRIAFVPPQPGFGLRFAYDVVRGSAPGQPGAAQPAAQAGTALAAAPSNTAVTAAVAELLAPPMPLDDGEAAPVPAPAVKLPVDALTTTAPSAQLRLPLPSSGPSPLDSSLPPAPPSPPPFRQPHRTSGAAGRSASSLSSISLPQPPQRKLRRQRTAEADVGEAAVATGLQRQRTAASSPSSPSQPPTVIPSAAPASRGRAAATATGERAQAEAAAEKDPLALRRVLAAVPRGHDWRNLAIVIHPSAAASATTLAVWKRRLPALGATVYLAPPPRDVVANSCVSSLLRAPAAASAMEVDCRSLGAAAEAADEEGEGDAEAEAEGPDMRALRASTRGLSISQADDSEQPGAEERIDVSPAAGGAGRSSIGSRSTAAAGRPGVSHTAAAAATPSRQPQQKAPVTVQQPYSTLARIFGGQKQRQAAAVSYPAVPRGGAPRPQADLGTAQVLSRLQLRAGAAAASSAGGHARPSGLPASAAGSRQDPAVSSSNRLIVVIVGDGVMQEDLAAWWAGEGASIRGRTSTSGSDVRTLPFATNVRRLSLQSQLPDFNSLSASDRAAALQRGFAAYHSPEWVFTGLSTGHRPPAGAHPWIAHSRLDALERQQARARDGGSVGSEASSDRGSAAGEGVSDDDGASAGSSLTGRKRKRNEAESDLQRIPLPVSAEEVAAADVAHAEPAATFCLPLLEMARLPAAVPAGSRGLRWWQQVYACCDAPGRWGVDSKTTPPLACPFSEAQILKATVGTLRQFPWLAVDLTAGRQFVEAGASAALAAGGSAAATTGTGASQRRAADVGVCAGLPHNPYGVARPPSLNNHITGPLQTLRGVYEVIRDERSDLRLKMVDHIIGALAYASFKVESADDLSRLSVSIPPTMRAKIVEILATGRLAQAEEAASTAHVRTLQLFDQVLWIGAYKGALSKQGCCFSCDLRVAC